VNNCGDLFGLSSRTEPTFQFGSFQVFAAKVRDLLRCFPGDKSATHLYSAYTTESANTPAPIATYKSKSRTLSDEVRNGPVLAMSVITVM